METLPRGLSPHLLEFCKSISRDRPRFVRSSPAQDAQPSACFDNVGRNMQRAGGSIAYGWAIWHMRGVYFEAEHHGVWRKRSGELLDVSPQLGGVSKILFLPDQSAVYDPQSFRSNVIQAEPGSTIGAEFVGSAQRRSCIVDGYRKGGAPIAFIRHEDQAAINLLDSRMRELLERIRS